MAKPHEPYRSVIVESYRQYPLRAYTVTFIFVRSLVKTFQCRFTSSVLKPDSGLSGGDAVPPKSKAN